MRATGAFLALVIGVSLCACSKSDDLGFGVAVTMHFASGVDDSSLARVTTLKFQSSGDESYATTRALGRAAKRTETTVYHPLTTSRSLSLAISAVDATGAVVASGSSGSITLDPDHTTSLDVELGSPSSGDGGTTGGCAGSPALLCEDFEQETIGAMDGWFTSERNGTVTIDPTRANRGTRSLHLHYAAVGANAASQAQLGRSTSFSLTHFYARAYVYIATTPAAALPTLALFALEQNASPYLHDQLGGDFGNTGLSPAISGTVASGSFSGPMERIPYDQWVCVEWNLENVDGTQGANGATRAWVDDALVIDGTAGIRTQATPALGQLVIGNFFSSSTSSLPAFDFWVDDLVLDDKRIGCSQ